MELKGRPYYTALMFAIYGRRREEAVRLGHS